MSFVAIDVETANPDMASICQIGIVVCEDGKLSKEWETYVDACMADPGRIELQDEAIF